MAQTPKQLEAKARYRNSAKGRATMQAYEAANREEINARRRAHYRANRAQKLAQQKASHQRHRDARRRQLKLNQMKINHGMFPEDWAALWEAQGGRCYLCQEIMAPGAKLDIDHDHSCCPRGKTCPSCRRGIAHSSCNCLIGLAGDDPDRLRRIADSLEAAKLAAAQRIARKDVQLFLGEGAA